VFNNGVVMSIFEFLNIFKKDYRYVPFEKVTKRNFHNQYDSAKDEIMLNLEKVNMLLSDKGYFSEIVATKGNNDNLKKLKSLKKKIDTFIVELGNIRLDN
jgi:hypothetical protein